MYLKNIEVQGFKSFANKTVFQFHNGITGIVGPNGTGKSNVADAVRWVLGEQRVKQLRGAAMQDVIFSGTQNRKPLGYASVSITLSNEDHALPISYNEVTVTRRLFRSGESEYLLNGTQCRLKDVNELFYDTGIGKEGYSIIGQGQIDKILSGKPEERRELFDEAAGIVKFKRRKQESTKKLDNVQASLVRVNDILVELEQRVGPLERQSEKARRYLQLKEDLKVYDVNLFLNEYQENAAQTDNIRQKHADAAEELAGVQKETEEVRNRHKEEELELDALEQRQKELSDQKNWLILQTEQMNSRIGILQEQIRSGEEGSRQQLERLSDIDEETVQKQKDLVRIRQEKEQLSSELETNEKQGIEAQEAYQECLEEIESIQTQLDECQQKMLELLNERAELTAKQQRIETMSEQIRIRKSRLGGEIQKLQSEQSGHSRQLDAIAVQLKDVQEKLDVLSEESSKADLKLQQCQEELGIDNQKMDLSQADYHREASRLETLKGIAERYDGYGNSIRRVMEQKRKEKGLLGVVADLVRTEEKYELAVETALGGSIQNIVTEEEDTARRMIEFLKKNQYGRATFLPLTAMKHAENFRQTQALGEKGVIGLASSLVKADDKYSDLVKNLLGRTIVVDHITSGIALEKKYRYSLRIVTLEGELLSPGGSMTGGAFKNNVNLLGRRREIEELTALTDKLKKELETLRGRIESTRGRRNSLRDKIREISEKMQELYLKQNTLNTQKTELENRKDSAAKDENRYQDESIQIRRQIMELSRDSVTLESQMETSRQKEGTIGKELSARQDAMDRARVREQQLLQNVQSMKLQQVSLTQKKQFLEQEQERLSQEIESLKAETANLKQTLAAHQTEHEEKVKEIERIRNEITSAEEKTGTLDKEQKTLEKKREEISVIQKTFFDRREELAQRASLLDREVYRLNAQIEKLTEHGEARIAYMWDEYGLTYHTALPLKRDDLGSKTAWRRQMADIKRQIRDLGNVNVNAIEEYKEVSERFNFLTAQREDIRKAEASLIKIISELDTGMRKQFREQFARIAEEYDKSFKQLFGGGSGTLELMEGEDILESGIRVIAQPPGKKLQNMLQLSGGEKALTAIALLFAIQNLKPSPFCLLDEIEAALDENNVDRYAMYLKELSTNTQFIIITHRRGTMAAADRLYGVTMQEKGVSALVSVNLIENELDA